jgi:hypothetical protein
MTQLRVTFVCGSGKCCCRAFKLLIYSCPFSRRPVTEAGERVTPSDLTAYRISHDFIGPCCLCAHDADMPQYVESSIYMAFDGPFFGEYVASCATNRCSYLGERGYIIVRCPLTSNV